MTSCGRHLGRLPMLLPEEHRSVCLRPTRRMLDQFTDVFGPPRGAAARKLYRLRVASRFDAFPPAGLAHRENAQYLWKSQEAGCRYIVHSDYLPIDEYYHNSTPLRNRLAGGGQRADRCGHKRLFGAARCGAQVSGVGRLNTGQLMECHRRPLHSYNVTLL